MKKKTKKKLHNDVYVLDIDIKDTKKWYLVLHAYVLTKYYRNDQNLQL